jgi:hypothetical protein
MMNNEMIPLRVELLKRSEHYLASKEKTPSEDFLESEIIN